MTSSSNTLLLQSISTQHLVERQMAAPSFCLHSTALIFQMNGLGGLSTTSLSDMSHTGYLIGELLSGEGELVGKNIEFIEIALKILPLKWYIKRQKSKP